MDGDEIIPGKTGLRLTLSQGRELPTAACDCSSCGGEWFVCALSADWTPRFCPYCGIEFVRMTRSEDGGMFDVPKEPAP